MRSGCISISGRCRPALGLLRQKHRKLTRLDCRRSSLFSFICSFPGLHIAETGGFFSDFRHIRVFIMFRMARRPSSRI